MKSFFLGVDTSNYTTSLSLVCEGQVISNIRRLLPVEHGKKGLRQSDAVFLHTKALPELSRLLFENAGISPEAIKAVGVSSKPRNAEGSYMPCFLAGISYASGIAHALNIPLYEFSHQCGHISAGIYSCGNDSDIFNDTFISFHISGGTTEALLTKKSHDGYECLIAGGTNDASCGQIIDRAGVMMGMDFPCGRELEKAALLSDGKTRLPLCVSFKNGYFSMSGLENKVSKFLSDNYKKEDIALFLFKSIAEAIKKSSLYLREKYGELPIIYAGGVMSNSIIRSELSKLCGTYFASSELSSDNACGTALLAYRHHLERS